VKPAISIQNLVKNYDSVEAVKRISFDIKNGEFFGLLGPNGAGKTTTINAITGLVNISSGNVNVFGQDVIKNYRETRKRIGLSQQDLMSLDRFLSVEEILTYQAGYFGIQKYEAQKRAEELLEHFDLASKRDVDIRKLSGGMKRRLSIAKALVHDPDILILDEPTAGLDVELRVGMWQDLRKFVKEGKTILLTTHYIEEAERLCERVGIIDHGQLIELDTTKNLIDKLSAQKVTVVVSGTIGKLSSSLKKLGVSAKKNRMRIYIDGDYSKVGKALYEIEKMGLKILEIRTAENRLENAFLRLTGNE
tara:strand:+ start:21419 stop:22336 length:918 start_codon:yes stop_codon:yes gene_type:complete